jgi:vitellogenic carboxypeptidase-like protein
MIEDNPTGTITPNPYSWNKEVHMLYWDQPVGTGYSYSDPVVNVNCYVTTEEQGADQFYRALQEFYVQHPQYRESPLYITGQSYAGKYNVFIANKILEENDKLVQGDSKKINLQGIAVGNGWINPKLQTKRQIDYGFAMGFIDRFQQRSVMKAYGVFVKALREGNMEEAHDKGVRVTEMIVEAGGNPNGYDVRTWEDLPIDHLAIYLSLPTVKNALNVPKDVEWSFGDDSGPVADNLKAETMRNVTTEYSLLLNELDESGTEKVRVLIYVGNFDLLCGYNGLEDAFNIMKWPHQREWLKAPRKIWVNPPAQTQGYVKSVANLMQVVVPNAGHQVPTQQPQISRSMIYNWIFGHEFTGYFPNFEEKHLHQQREKRKSKRRYPPALK